MPRSVRCRRAYGGLSHRARPNWPAESRPAVSDPAMKPGNLRAAASRPQRSVHYNAGAPVYFHRLPLIDPYIIDNIFRWKDRIVDPLVAAPVTADGNVELQVERLVERPALSAARAVVAECVVRHAVDVGLDIIRRPLHTINMEFRFGGFRRITRRQFILAVLRAVLFIVYREPHDTGVVAYVYVNIIDVFSYKKRFYRENLSARFISDNGTDKSYSSQNRRCIHRIFYSFHRREYGSADAKEQSGPTGCHRIRKPPICFLLRIHRSQTDKQTDRPYR